MTKESDIVFETALHWVRKLPSGAYEVYRKGDIASVRVAQIGYKGEKGLRRAMEEVERREGQPPKTAENPSPGEHVSELGDYFAEAHPALAEAEKALSAGNFRKAHERAAAAEVAGLYGLLQVQYLWPYIGQEVETPEYKYTVPSAERLEAVLEEGRNLVARAAQIRFESLCEKQRDLGPAPKAPRGGHLRVVKNPAEIAVTRADLLR